MLRTQSVCRPVYLQTRPPPTSATTRAPRCGRSPAGAAASAAAAGSAAAELPSAGSSSSTLSSSETAPALGLPEGLLELLPADTKRSRLAEAVAAAAASAGGETPRRGPAASPAPADSSTAAGRKPSGMISRQVQRYAVQPRPATAIPSQCTRGQCQTRQGRKAQAARHAPSMSPGHSASTSRLCGSGSSQCLASPSSAPSCNAFRQDAACALHARPARVAGHAQGDMPAAQARGATI